jgi:hypothetical protein
MKESYRKGVANHPDLDPCEGGGNVALEALGRGTYRLGIPEVDELRNSQKQKRRQCQANRKATLRRATIRERDAGTAESKTPCMYGNFTRENRPDRPPLWGPQRDPVAIRGRKAAERWEKAMSYKTHANGGRES